MKFRRIARFHGLKRPRVRQTWNKYNLYNLARLREPNLIPRTFFQQKWAAKALTRGYHGEHIKERAWERMFSRRLLSAVDVDPAYLATNDGSELASGRGSGRHEPPVRGSERQDRKPASITSYMQMIYAPMERRLDQAIFRALFASSARQARQFCVHGAVRVNGVRMKYPGYLLNPGDMFQVDIEKVMYATGRKKVPTAKLSKHAPKRANNAEGEAAADEEAAESEEVIEQVEELDEAAKQKQMIATINQLRERAKKIIEKSTDLSAKRKRALRALMRDVKHTYSRAVIKPDAKPEAEDLVEQLTQMLTELEVSPSEAKARENAEAKDTEEAKEREESGGLETPEERQILKRLIQEELENPVDLSKPYATPWKPRPYMQAFAFIPRYLEVNQNICAAVYLRHPVARQGYAEVPTPFSQHLNQLAFNWYLRRG